MLRVIIIDDEPFCVGILEVLLKEYSTFPLEIVGVAGSVARGIDLIDKERPALVFLDIKLKGGYAFDILEHVKFQNFKIIFTTAYNDYAIKAFDFATIHYLLKPIDEESLYCAIDKYVSQTTLLDSPYQNLKESITKGEIKKMGIPSLKDTIFVDIKDILYLEADKSYTFLYTTKGEKTISTKSLKHYADLLESNSAFFRVHHKFIANLAQVKKYIKGLGGQILMSNGELIDVSKRRKKDFLKALAFFSIS